MTGSKHTLLEKNTTSQSSNCNIIKQGSSVPCLFYFFLSYFNNSVQMFNLKICEKLPGICRTIPNTLKLHNKLQCPSKHNIDK